MKALTIRQPWAWAIAAGHKPVENRTWTTRYRGPLAIHAAQAWDENGELYMARWLIKPPWWPLGAINQKPPTGVFVAVADLIDIHRAAVIQPCCLDWGQVPASADDMWFHWRLDNVRPLSQPVAGTGRQGLWTVPEDAAEFVARYARPTAVAS